MGYWITTFGTVSLPRRREVQDVSGGQAYSGLMELPGGRAFDAAGTAQTRRGPYRLEVQGAIHSNTPATLNSRVRELQALVGKYDYLYRTPDGGSADSERVWARCLGVAITRDVRHRTWVEPQITFEVQSPTWQGTALHSTSGTLSSGGTLTVTNAGNAPVYDAVVTAVASGAAFTDIVIENTTAGYVSYLHYGTAVYPSASGGTVSDGGTLSIDAGALSVTNNGTAAFSKFELGDAHEIDDWLRLAPGENAIRVTFDGGADVVFTVQHRDSWG